MKLESITCPKCGAPLHFDNPDQEYCFCSHCGTQVYKEDIHFDEKMSFEKHKVDVNAQLEVEKLKNNKVEVALTTVMIIVVFIIIAIMYSFLL